ncbi:MAG: GtrA family protein [Halioglobus sp.]
MFGSVSKYAMVGILGTVTHFGLLYILVEWLSIAPLPATSIAFVWVALQSYVLSKNWVFDSDNSHSTSLPRFIAVSVTGFFGNLGIMYVAVNILSFWYMAAQAIAILIIPPMNYLMNRYWTFR